MRDIISDGSCLWFLLFLFPSVPGDYLPSPIAKPLVIQRLGYHWSATAFSSTDAEHTCNKTSDIVVTQSICLMRDAERVLTGSTRCMEQEIKSPEIVLGGIVRGDASVKQLSLVFTGHEFADGATTIREVLKENAIKGAFFLTGDFYRLYPNIARDLQQKDTTWPLIRISISFTPIGGTEIPHWCQKKSSKKICTIIIAPWKRSA